MKVHALAAAAASLGLVVTLGSCSGGGSSSGGTMFVQTCSLGCSNGQSGQQISCAIVSTFVNQEINVYFSEPIDPASLTSTSFSLIDVNSGATPLGVRFVDPNNPRKVIFRPNVTFDDQGNATFGFGPDRTYRLILPGEAQGDSGPFVLSVGGRANQSRLQCDIRTTLGVVDSVPGAPTVTVKIDTIDPLTNVVTPGVTVPKQPAAIIQNAWQDTRIRFTFNDLMNPVTLANPTSGQFTFVSVQVDVDGDLSTEGSNDRITLPGFATVQLNAQSLSTTMVFTPTGGLPPLGSGALPRLVIVNVPSNCQDLAGNGVTNAGLYAFAPEAQEFDVITLPDADGENFATTASVDAARTSAEIITDPAPTRLTRGIGGGSGRLGDLIIRAGATITLNTDSQEFPIVDPQYTDVIRDLLDNEQPGIDYDPATPPTITVTNGQFEFTSILVEIGGTLRFVGSNPVRLFCRGPMRVFGTIDVSGAPATGDDDGIIDGFFSSDTIAGGAGGIPGPNGGVGGEGASRNDTTDPQLIAAGGVNIDRTSVDVHLDGLAGGGVGQTGNLAAGEGGIATPLSNSYPTGELTGDPAQLQGLLFTDVDSLCESHQIGSPGGGGAYATDGTAAFAVTDFTTDINGNSNLPAFVASGGSSTALGLEPPDPPQDHVIRQLIPEAGYLRGGSGGGGGGGSLFGTTANGSAPSCIGTNVINNFWDHSSAGGGGGGGAIQIVSGRTITLTGLVDATGGDGGSGLTSLATQRPTRAQPGGGGSGGAVKLQALAFSMPVTGSPRIDVRGGIGGRGSLPGKAGVALGGDGGAGLVRIEDRTGSPSSPGYDRTELAAVTAPTFDGDPESKPITSTGHWAQPRQRPESFTGMTSCWIRPSIGGFALIFAEDEVGSTDPDDMGWNLDVVLNTGGGNQLVAYRGTDPGNPFPSGDLQTNLKSFINVDLPPGETGSYFAVRFQGAVSFAAIEDFCDVPLTGPTAKIVSGSLTPWVQHPKDLNEFLPHPNMLRYCVVFDVSLVTPGSIPSFIRGVTNLKVKAQPD